MIIAEAYFLGVVSDPGMQILGYPPLHIHHFHVERIGSNVAEGGFITHGDDQCLPVDGGGVNCLIRVMPNGYAQYQKLPLHVSAEINDVRAAGASPLRWWIAWAFQGDIMAAARITAPTGLQPEGLLAPFTQIRIVIEPKRPWKGLHARTWALPSSSHTVMVREGMFTVDGELLWSYAHEHAAWAEEASLYVDEGGGSPLEKLLLHNASGRPYPTSEATVANLRSQLAARTAQTGIRRVCQWERSANAPEVHNGTLEIDGRFYRKSTGCLPFRMWNGLRFVAVVFTSPASASAATASSPIMKGYVGIHSIFRLFVSIPEVTLLNSFNDGAQWVDNDGSTSSPSASPPPPNPSPPPPASTPL